MNDDTLSEVLRAVRLRSAVFFDVEASSPWVAEAPPSSEIAHSVMPGFEHVIEYHFVASGSCWASPINVSAPPIRVVAGDVVAFPHGDAHVLSSEPGMRGKPNLSDYRAPKNASELPFLLNSGGGGMDRTQFICGFLGCDLYPFNPLIESLPRMLHAPGTDLSRGRWWEELMRFALRETVEKRAGAGGILAKIGEVMFVELLRYYVETIPKENTGLLRGVQDRQISRALNSIHQQPAYSWTLERLAKNVGMSRSSFSERFTDLVGMSPMHYIQNWRLQVAASRLLDQHTKISRIAEEVGYESEAAFTRAFKKSTGLPPAAWRSRKLSLSKASSPDQTVL